MVLELFENFLIAMLVFVPLERILPRHKDKKIFRKSWGIDTTYALVASILTSMGSLVVIVAGYVLLDFIISEEFRQNVRQQPLILQIIEIFIIADIGYYWIHRAFHQIPALWRIHAIHHSIEDMDWLASHRVHPLDQILTRGVSLILPFALGFETAALFIWASIFGWHSAFNHSNIKIKFGPLKWLIVSPIYHRWHHANEKHAFDKNFAGQLPIFDILFGTAIMDENKEPNTYGTDTPVPDNFVDQLIMPLRKPKLDQATP